MVCSISIKARSTNSTQTCIWDIPFSGQSGQPALQDAYWKMSSKAIGLCLQNLISPRSKENIVTHHSMELSMPELHGEQETAAP
jgi:hypothetical protein